MLAEQQPQINLLKLEYGPHLITKNLEALRTKRMTYTSLIALQVKVHSKADINNSNDAVKLVQSVVNLYLKNLISNSEGTIQQRLSEFFRVVDEREELETAIASLELTSYMNELRNVNSTIKEQLIKRKSSIAARPSINIPPIAKSVAAALRNLFNQINLAQARNTELDYTQLISDLNYDLTYYRGLISMRATILENKKTMAEKGEGVEIETQNLRNFVAPTHLSTEKSMNLDVEGKKDSDLNVSPLNEKKTAARSSKNEQLPSIDDEEIVS